MDDGYDDDDGLMVDERVCVSLSRCCDGMVCCLPKGFGEGCAISLE